MPIFAQAQLPLLVSGLSALAIFIIVLGAQREWRQRHNSVADRLRQMEVQRQGLLRDAVPPAEAGQMVAALNKLAGRVGLAEQLARAGIPLTAGEFILIVAILSGLGLVVSVVLHNFVLFSILVMGAWFGPRWWIAQRRAKRIRDFDRQLPGTIVLLANALRSGSSNVAQALAMAAQQSQPPMSKELTNVVREINLGKTVKEGLIHLTERVASVDLELLVTAIGVQIESGGNLVQMLERISETIRERVRLNGEIKSLTAQQRYSGYVVALMPVAISLLMLLFNPNYILGVFRSTQWCGMVMFGTAAVMIVVGVVVIQKVVDVKV